MTHSPISSFRRTGVSRPLLSAVLFALIATGCQESPPPAPTMSAEDLAMQTLRGTLSGVAESGEAGSALQGFDSAILSAPVSEDVRAKLLEGYKKLSVPTDPEKNKEVAQDLLATLPPA